jgi:hypothetical protein
MKDRDSLNLFESYKQVTESGDFEGGVRLHKPTGEWERLVDYLIQKGHGEIEAKTQATSFLKDRRDVKPEDQVQAEDGSAEDRYDEPYRKKERAKFNNPHHRQLQAKMQGDHDRNKSKKFKVKEGAPEDDGQENEFSTDPEHEDYDKVTHLLDQLVSAELDYNSDSEEEAVSSLIARLMEHPSYIGAGDAEEGEPVRDDRFDSAVGSSPDDGRFPW